MSRKSSLYRACDVCAFLQNYGKESKSPTPQSHSPSRRYYRAFVTKCGSFPNFRTVKNLVKSVKEWLRTVVFTAYPV